MPKLTIKINVNEHTAWEDIAHQLTSFAATLCDPRMRDQRLVNDEGEPLNGFSHEIQGPSEGVAGFYVVEG